MTRTDKANDWFLRDGESETGGFSEAELRQTLVQIPDEHLDRYEVRQGKSPWHSARQVMKLFRQLARQGVYVRVDDRIQGPFTWQRAGELIAKWEGVAGEVRVKIGRDEAWQTAEGFQALLREQQQRAVGSGDDDIVAAIPFDPKKPSAGTHTADRDEPIPAIAYEPPPTSSAIKRATTPTRTAPAKSKPVISSEPTTPVPNPNPAVNPYQRPPGGIRQASRPSAKKRQVTVIIVAAVAVIMVGGLMLVGGVVWLLSKQRTANRALSAPGVALTEDADITRRNASAQPPRVDPNTLFRPNFITRNGESMAGTIFAARLTDTDTDPILLSALHLLGTAGGFPRDVSGREVLYHWMGVGLQDSVTGATRGTVDGRVLSIPEAKSLPDVSLHGDVIAFLPYATDDRDDRSNFNTLMLSSTRPTSGEVIWLISEVIGSPSLIHRGVVLGEEDGWLAYQFDRKLNLRGTSGAPVVDRHHHVIAVNAGGGEQDGKTIGVGTPVSKFRRVLADAKR